jgi:hypothetical protein
MQKHNDFLQALYETCRAMGFVNNQYEFSALCGKQTSWFSAAKSLNRPLSVSALVTLQTRIKTRTSTDLPRHMRSTAKKLTEQLHLLLTERVK